MADLSRISSESVVIDEPHDGICARLEAASADSCFDILSVGSESVNTFTDSIPGKRYALHRDSTGDNESARSNKLVELCDDVDDDDDDLSDGSWMDKEVPMRLSFKDYLANEPSRIDHALDRNSIRAYRQSLNNDFILQQSKQATVNRQDHHAMLRQLISEAYYRDPRRREHRQEWRALIAAIRKEYWGAKAIFTLSPDPYHDVLAKLSSMTIWNNDGAGNFAYGYHENALVGRRARQQELLNRMKRTGKLFE